MVRAEFTKDFQRKFSKIKDSSLKEKIIKQIKKIKENPEIGKPMKNVRKGTRELYIKPFRLSYAFLQEKELVYILDLYHKDKQ
ncbi:type II toxin-antitoxin system RelE/ParE family toxin [Candidatus Woesearchaeota archaeon]|nr:type II toxin-antitoxin system RelE/ParE family toxin [Candidatus Woesearchaeota archaeon]MBT5739935.1 type II toxin-antitoxin system RelE/ParE family toxin [Candidatus Woesearchaeota archaeon]